jgi:aminomethyltransferase
VTETQDETTLATTPLDALHRGAGARMVGFAGFAMPLHYRSGIIAEHLHCRTAASLFDVSHMGQASLRGAGAAAALERLVPGDIQGLKPGRQRYTLLMTEGGGILDDLMVARGPAAEGEVLRLVVNASRRAVDYAHLAAHLPVEVRLERHDDRALLALQGPLAAAVLARLAPAVAALGFMAVADLTLAGATCWVARAGYTGEDGFEISVPAAQAPALAAALLEAPEVALAGLGARDSLRLEAGLPLYGNDIDETTDPIAAGLAWTIGKRRRMAWDFAGAAAVQACLDDGPARLRVGLRPEGRAPARAGTPILAAQGQVIGQVTSGGFSPSLGAPIAMGYIRRDHAADGTPVRLMVRSRELPAIVVPLPFVPHRYSR